MKELPDDLAAMDEAELRNSVRYATTGSHRSFNAGRLSADSSFVSFGRFMRSGYESPATLDVSEPAALRKRKPGRAAGCRQGAPPLVTGHVPVTE